MKNAVIMLIFAFMLAIASLNFSFAEETRIIRVSPSYEQRYLNSTFFVNITFSSPTPLLAMQCEIKYNPDVLHAIEVYKGNAFEGWSGDIAPWLIEIDNENGVIKGLFAYSPQGVYEGVFARINFIGVAMGESNIELTNVIAGDENDIPVNIAIYNGSIEIVSYPWDVNMDGSIDVLDMIIIAQHWMETPENPNWYKRADVNNDGVVNVLDLITVGQHFD